MLPAVKRVGKAYAARRGRRSGERGSMNLSLSGILPSFDSPCDYARARCHSHAGFHDDFPFRTEEDVHARSEFDQSDALAGGNLIARLLIAHDAARDQSGDLFEDYGRAAAFHCDDVLLIFRGT